MWYLIGMVNVIIVILFIWFWNKKYGGSIEEVAIYAFGLAFILGPLGTLIILFLLLYLIINFHKNNKK